MNVSIITVCFNSSQYIRSAIESVLSQTYPNIEYIVIDGGSTDRTMNIINEYLDNITHLVNEPDKGIYDAMNKGIALATGDIIGILNSDDFYTHSDVLAHVAKAFSQNPDIDMLLCNVDFVLPSDLTKPVRFYSSINFVPWKLRFGFMPAHPGTFIKKSAYERVGSYKLGYKIGADFDMFVRMLLVKRFHYLKLNKVLVRMRTGGVSTSGIASYVTSTKEMVRSLKENNVYSNVFMVLMRLPIKFFQKMLVKFKIK